MIKVILPLMKGLRIVDLDDTNHEIFLLRGSTKEKIARIKVI